MPYRSPIRCGRLLSVSVLIAGVVYTGRYVAAEVDESSGSETATIRMQFLPGRMMRYNLKLGGQTAWTPHVRGVQWGQMATDFTFTLRTKTIRPSGACTDGAALRLWTVGR